MPEEKASAKYNKVNAYLLGFISFVLFVYILMALREILIPVTIAIFMTYLFHPLVVYLEKHKIPKWASIVIILLFISGLYYLLALILLSSFNDISDKQQVYSANLSSFIQSILNPFHITIKELADILKIKLQKYDIDSLFKGLFEAGIIQDTFNILSSLLADFFISLFFWVFMIMGKDRFEERLKNAFSENREAVERNLNSIDDQLQSYITIKTILSLINAVIAMIIFWIFGIDFAIIWGLLTFILNFIPNIGSFIATLGPILIALMQYGFGFTAIAVAALLLISHNIVGNLIEPHYMGRHMDLSPVFVLFSLIFWGWIWGIVGMFLAVPIAASMKIFFSNIGPLKPIAILMGSKSGSPEDLVETG
jgi:predicted PurR-regulated permease PerM